MPIPAAADAKTAIGPPQSDTAKVALDTAELSASETVKSESREPDNTRVASRGYATIAVPKAHASKKADAQRGPPRPKPRAVISTDPAAAEERYINRGQLRELIPASDMTLWRWQRDPKIAFPPSVKLGAGGRNFWWLPAIRAWMRQREACPSISDAR